MRKTILTGVVCAIVVAACGGSSPAGDCNHAVAVICSRSFQCYPTQSMTMYGNESACETILSSQYKCNTLACMAGQTYDGTMIEACINAYNSAACADLGTPPAQCNNFMFQPTCK